MIKWIQFEDSYGVFDIFMKVTGFVPVDRHAIFGTQLNDKLYCRQGIGNTWRGGLSLESKFASETIDQIYLVFDVDNLSGNKSDILEIKDIIECVSGYRQLGCQVYYMPVVFAAETLALIQYCDVLCRPESFISKVNTNALQNALLTLLTGVHNKGYIKKIHKYLDIVEMKRWVECVNKDSIVNKKCFEWIYAGCPVEPQYFMVGDEVITYMQEIRRWYAESQKNLGDYIRIRHDNRDIVTLPLSHEFRIVDSNTPKSELDVEMTRELKDLKLRQISMTDYEAIEPMNNLTEESRALGNMIDALKAMTYKDVNKD